MIHRQLLICTMLLFGSSVHTASFISPVALKKLSDYKRSIIYQVDHVKKCLKGDTNCNPQEVLLARSLLAFTIFLITATTVSGSLYVMKQRNKPTVTQIPVPRQVGNTCGFWSINNALCLAQMVGKGPIRGLHTKPQTFTSSTEKAYEVGKKGEWREFVEKLRKEKPRDLSPDEVGMLTDMLDSDEMVALIKQVQQQQPSAPEFVIFSPDIQHIEFYDPMIKDTNGLQQTINDFKTSHHRVLPVIVQIKVPQGPHWVVDILHKGTDNKIYHTLADSFNTNLLANPIIQNIIQMTE